MAVTRLPLARLTPRDEANIRRTYAITAAQDAWIRERARRTGNPWAYVVREILADAMAADSAKAK